MYYHYFDVHCVCGYDERQKNSKMIMQCTGCKTWQHKDCLKAMIKMRNYLCPHCQIMKGGLFYNIIYTLLEPSLFQIESNKENRGTYSFIPDTNIYPEINKIVKDDPEFIIIRCLRFDKTGFSFHWPKMSKIYMNNKLILDFTQKGSKKKDRMIALLTRKEFESEDYTNNKFLLYDANIVIIDNFVYDKRPNRIEINVNYTSEDNMENTNFAISIDCVEILREPNEIMKKVPTYSEKAKLKELLTNNEDDNVSVLASTKEKISLLDLYTESERIKLPARGINCCHLNVFDLQTFLLLNRKTNKYQCPYCKRYANNLYIDGIILAFIKNEKNFDVDEILIDKDHNILSYLHKSTNEFVENDRSYFISGAMHHKEHFDLNKKFVIDLNPALLQGTRSFFENKKYNVISNFGQIFDIMKDDIINNQNDKNHFTNESICLSKNPSNNFLRFHKKNIVKYIASNNNNKDNKDNKDNKTNNALRCYDIIEDKNANHNELFVPDLDDDETTEQSISYKKDITFMNRKTKDIGSDMILHKSIFDLIEPDN